jgi:CHAT domain-containing protein
LLSTREYARISGRPSYLFTAACLTGFGEAVGTELFGSIVDYDHAGLRGAILTSWPIHGAAATVATRFFYDDLAVSLDAARALKRASHQTRELLPHPYLWAPFSIFGDWNVQGILPDTAEPL